MGLKPVEIDNSTGAEIMRMWEGYRWRRREQVRPFALQTFFTLGMFSKDITLDMVLRDFGVIEAEES